MSNRIYLFIFCFFIFLSANGFAEKVVWSAHVKADGTPSEVAILDLNQQYIIRASGFVNLGKWMQGGEKLANDACYEFNDKVTQKSIVTLRNSQNVSICDGAYHPDHIYLSNPFIAKQNKIHFWINDVDYDDNSGALQVEIIHRPEGTIGR